MFSELRNGKRPKLALSLNALLAPEEHAEQSEDDGCYPRATGYARAQRVESGASDINGSNEENST